MTAIAVGEKAPGFELKDQNGTLHRLKDLGGRMVLLSFHPLAWTGVCQRQMESLEMNADTFNSMNAVAFGISVDAPPSKKAWAESMHVTQTSLLSDFWPHGGLAQQLGLFKQESGVSERANVVVDSRGIVRWVKVYPAAEVPNLEEVLAAMRRMPATSKSHTS